MEGGVSDMEGGVCVMEGQACVMVGRRGLCHGRRGLCHGRPGLCDGGRGKGGRGSLLQLQACEVKWLLCGLFTTFLLFINEAAPGKDKTTLTLQALMG